MSLQRNITCMVSMFRFSLLFSFWIGVLWSFPTPDHINNFYGDFVPEASQAFATTNQTPSGNFAGVTLWCEQPSVFTGTATSAAFACEYNRIQAIVEKYGFSKVVYFVGTPNTHPFFSQTATAADSLVQLLQSNPMPSGVEFEILFDESAWTNSPVPPAGTQPTQSEANKNQLNVASYFNDLTDKLDYLLALKQAVTTGTQITGVVIDPQPSPGSTVVNTAQVLLNFMRGYLAENAAVSSLNLGVTYGYGSDEVTASLANGCTFSLPSAVTSRMTPSGSWDNFFQSSPYWSGTNYVVDNVYIQVYDGSFPYIFATQQTNESGDAGAGQMMLNMLTRVPYRQAGTQVTTSGTTATLSGGATTGNNSVCPVESRAAISTGNLTNVAPVVSLPGGVSSGATSFSLSNAGLGDHQSPTAWLNQEVIMQWFNLSSSATPGVNNKIHFMFNTGNQDSTTFKDWSEGQLQNFITDFQTRNTINGVPTKIAIYDFDYMVGLFPTSGTPSTLSQGFSPSLPACP